MFKVEDRTIGRKDYKRYPKKRVERIPVETGYAEAEVKFLYTLNYHGRGITSLVGYPRGTRVVICGGALAGQEAYISEFHLAMMRYRYFGRRTVRDIETMCTLKPIPIVEDGDKNGVFIPDFSDEKNGKKFLFDQNDYDVVDDSMRLLSHFHCQPSGRISVVVIDQKGDRKIKPSVHVIGKKGDSHEVEIDKLIAHLQELKEGVKVS